MSRFSPTKLAEPLRPNYRISQAKDKIQMWREGSVTPSDAVPAPAFLSQKRGIWQKDAD